MNAVYNSDCIKTYLNSASKVDIFNQKKTIGSKKTPIDPEEKERCISTRGTE